MTLPQSSQQPMAGTEVHDEAEEVEQEAQFRRERGPLWLRILWANRKSRVGLILLGLFAVVAVFAPLIAPFGPSASDFRGNQNPNRDHLLGTTTNGEDIFSQLVWGTRTSLLVGIFAGGIVTAISLVIGLLAGYLQGWIDDFLSFLINLALVIPTLPLIAIFASYSPVRGVWVIIVILGLTGWAYGARTKRAQIMTLRTREYITAARLAGDGTWRIVFREILPNMLSLTVAAFVGAAAGAIGAEAGLAFLGLGDPDTVSWGTTTYWATNSGALLTGQWAWIGAPGLLLALLMTSLTLINFGVDALSNPHLREN
ncbi:MAG TPA: ABC transporter permease [Thermomicrobiales bacterium]|nr:ABC transporter permease [Thermomicrobiales bacterium]